MPMRSVDRSLADASVDFGQHTLTITVAMQSDALAPTVFTILNNGRLPPLGDLSHRSYYRRVSVRAKQNGDTEFENTTYVDMDPPNRHGPIARLTGNRRRDVPSIHDHVIATVEPVLDDLEEFYALTATEYEVDIEVETAVHRLDGEISQTDVKDELERWSQGIDALTDDP